MLSKNTAVVFVKNFDEFNTRNRPEVCTRIRLYKNTVRLCSPHRIP